MNARILFAPLSLFLLVSSAAFAADTGKVTFLSPLNGATVSSTEKVMVSYEAVMGSRGDHLHLYLDGKKLDVLRQAKGSAEVGTLAPGKHHICLTINTSWHFSTGVEGCIDVTSK